MENLADFRSAPFARCRPRLLLRDGARQPLRAAQHAALRQLAQRACGCEEVRQTRADGLRRLRSNLPALLAQRGERDVSGGPRGGQHHGNAQF